MTIGFFLGIGVYFLLMAIIGLFASYRVKTLEDFLIAGRCLPFYLALPTVVATWFGAGSSMGVSGTVYSEGFYGVLADPFGCSIALLIGGLFFAAPFRRLRLLTISDLLRNSYGSIFEKVSSLIVLPFYIGTLASQMLAMGFIFQILSGANLELGITIGALIVVTYTVFGGMWAVTLTDFIQFTLMGVGLIILIPITINRLDNPMIVFDMFLKEFSSITPQTKDFPLNWLSYAGRILMTGLGAIMGQDLLQRFLASRSEEVARYSGILGAFVYFFLGLIPLFIGIAGREIYPHLDHPEYLIPLLAKDSLSPIVFMIFACGLFSAIMSTADSYLLAGTTLAAHNVIFKIWPLHQEKTKILILRLVNIGIALIALLLAFSGQSIFNLMVHSGAMLFVAIFFPACGALFTRQANAISAWCSMSAGITTWLGFVIFYFSKSIPLKEDHLFGAAAFGGLCSFLTYILMSLTTKIFKFPNRKEELVDASLLTISKNRRI